MRDYKHLTRFSGEDKALLERAREATGLTINELIVRSTREQVPQIVADRNALNLAPLSESKVAAAYESMTSDELNQDRLLGRASMRAQTAKK